MSKIPSFYDLLLQEISLQQTITTKHQDYSEKRKDLSYLNSFNILLKGIGYHQIRTLLILLEYEKGEWFNLNDEKDPPKRLELLEWWINNLQKSLYLDHQLLGNLLLMETKLGPKILFSSFRRFQEFKSQSTLTTIP